MRSRLRAEHGPPPSRRCRTDQFVWLRRPQHDHRRRAVRGLSAALAESSVDWLEAVRQVVAAVRSSDVTELELANGEFSVRVRRDPEAPVAAERAGPLAHGPQEEADTGVHRVVAPFTGVFYRSPPPSAR